METYSYSRIKTFETCPKKFEFTYLKKIKPPFEGIEAFMGVRVHETLEFLYKSVMMTKTPDLNEILNYYNRRWEEMYSTEIMIVKAEFSIEHYRALGEDAIKKYYGRYSPFNEGTTVGLEKAVEFCLDVEGKYKLTGVIDRITKISDDEWEIHDYKTGSNLPSKDEVDSDEQLALYQIALLKLFPHLKSIKLIWHYLVFDQEMRSVRTPLQLDNLKRCITERIDSIEKTTEFTTKSSQLCEWCAYKPICPAFKHEISLQMIPKEEAKKDKGLNLVDRYMKVSSEIEKLIQEKDDLTKRIIDFSEEEGIDTLTGTHHKIKIWRYNQVILPEYNEPARALLEETLAKNNILKDFSSLSTFKLSKAIQDGSISSEVINEIRTFIKISESAKLYPREKNWSR